MRYSLTLVSQNKKLGPMPVVTASHDTCPTTCPLKNKGCYADHGPLAIHWKRVSEKGVSIGELCQQIRRLPKRQMYRYGQAGDLPTLPEDRDLLVTANAGRPVIAFTHIRDEATVQDMTARGFHVNYSCDNLDEVDNLSLETSAVVVIPSEYQRKKTETVSEYRARIGGKLKMRTPRGRPVAICPATYLDAVNCMSCGLCAGRRPNGTVIAFPAHGSRRRAIDKAYPLHAFSPFGTDQPTNGVSGS